VILGIVVTFFCSNANDDREANEWMAESAIALEQDEEYLHDCEKLIVGGH
jgi:hypothetical protein